VVPRVLVLVARPPWSPEGSLALVPRVLGLVARHAWSPEGSLAVVPRVLVLVARPPWSPEGSLAVVPRVLVLVARPPWSPEGSKEENQQRGTSTLARTAKEIHNLLLKEQTGQDDGGSDGSLCSDHRLSENASPLIDLIERPTTITIRLNSSK